MISWAVAFFLRGCVKYGAYPKEVDITIFGFTGFLDMLIILVTVALIVLS